MLRELRRKVNGSILFSLFSDPDIYPDISLTVSRCRHQAAAEPPHCPGGDPVSGGAQVSAAPDGQESEN